MVAAPCLCVKKCVIVLHVHHKILFFFIRTQPNAGEVPITCQARLIICLYPSCSLIDMGDLEGRALHTYFMPYNSR